MLRMDQEIIELLKQAATREEAAEIFDKAGLGTILDEIISEVTAIREVSEDDLSYATGGMTLPEGFRPSVHTGPYVRCCPKCGSRKVIVGTVNSAEAAAPQTLIDELFGNIYGCCADCDEVFRYVE